MRRTLLLTAVLALLATPAFAQDRYDQVIKEHQDVRVKQMTAIQGATDRAQAGVAAASYGSVSSLVPGGGGNPTYSPEATLVRKAEATQREETADRTLWWSIGSVLGLIGLALVARKVTGSPVPKEETREYTPPPSVYPGAKSADPGFYDASGMSNR